MPNPTFSEKLFEEFCYANGVPFIRIPTGRKRTPDYHVTVSNTVVTCEVKQINPNREDLDELSNIEKGDAVGRYLPNRLRGILKNVSRQLKAASVSGRPTLLVIYDNTPFKTYTNHSEVVQALFGQHSVTVRSSNDPGKPLILSRPFLGGNRGLGYAHNTSLSAIGILDGGPTARPLKLRIYHNPYAKVPLDPELFLALPVTHAVLPDANSVSL